MSGTRSHLHKAPAIECRPRPSLLIVAHGECGGTGGDRLVYRLADRVRGWPQFSRVDTCFIRAEPSIKDVTQSLPPGETTVYPLFMSDGYYVKRAIPDYLGSGSRPGAPDRPAVRIMRPIGLSPKLPKLVADLARRAALGAGIDCRKAILLLAAHGSTKSPESRDATLAVASALENANLFGGVEAGFLEEAPFLGDQLADLSGPVVTVGLFIGEGMHGAEDLPRAVRECGRDDLVLAAPLSRSPALIDLICDELAGGPRVSD
jgi:sirohydrochlorin cobaltochelatase